MPQIQCIHCGQEMYVDDTIAGTSTACPACHGSIFIPRISQPTQRRIGAPPPLASGRATTKSSGGGFKTLLIVGVAVVFFLAVMGGGAFLALNFIQKKKAEVVAERKAEKEVLQGMATDIEKLMGEMRDENGLPKESDFRLKTGNAATTDAERMRDVMSAYLNDMAALQNQYLRDLDKAGLQQLMEPERLRKDTTSEQTQKILADCRKLAEGMRQKGLEYMNTFPKRLDGQGFSDKIKRDILKGYEDGKRESMSKFTEMWDLELSTLDHMQSACEHLLETKDAWSSQEGQFVFNNDPDLNKFNGYMKKIEQNTARQTQLSEGAMSKALNTLKGP